MNKIITLSFSLLLSATAFVSYAKPTVYRWHALQPK